MPVITSYPPGRQIDHYIITRLLGQGIANRVYLAQDITNQQEVILKCPREDVIGGAAIFEAYRQEAEVGKLLHHPSLQRLLNQDEQRQKQYLVLEYIPGRVLRKIIREHPRFIMPEEEVVPLLLPVCNVLTYIHASGIIHRDVKPENILVGEDGKITLLDFGISLNKDKIATTKRRKPMLPFTDVIGTPSYMPPERLQGHPGDERTDVYAIGVTLYEMLCGHTPFEDADGFTIINKQIAFDPPDIQRLNSNVSPALATVIMRAIRRNPDKRYVSMQHLFDALNHLDKVRPEEYIPDSPLFGGRYRQVLQITLVIFLIILGLVAFGVIAQLFYHVSRLS